MKSQNQQSQRNLHRDIRVAAGLKPRTFKKGNHRFNLIEMNAIIHKITGTVPIEGTNSNLFRKNLPLWKTQTTVDTHPSVANLQMMLKELTKPSRTKQPEIHGVTKVINALPNWVVDRVLKKVKTIEGNANGSFKITF